MAAFLCIKIIALIVNPDANGALPQILPVQANS